MLDLPHSLSFGGREVRYGSVGEGTPMVLIHGTPFSSQVWRKIAPHLARRFKVYYFDLIGYGRSSKADGDVSLGVQNEVLAALFREWDLERPHVLAHDFGGATALRAWTINELTYRSLVLMDSVALRPWGSPLVQHVRDNEAAFSGMPEYMHEAVLRAYIQTAAHQTLHPEDMQVYLDPWLGPDGQSAFYRQIVQMDTTYTEIIEPDLEKLPFPTLVVWGEQDGWLPLSQGKKLASLLTDRPIEVLPSAGHLVQEDAPEAVVALALNFFSTG